VVEFGRVETKYGPQAADDQSLCHFSPFPCRAGRRRRPLAKNRHLLFRRLRAWRRAAPCDLQSLQLRQSLAARQRCPDPRQPGTVVVGAAITLAGGFHHQRDLA
ncbi:hypothetical protein, partial [Ancylobacter vacuolatus]|uniref:hypothetical protein n=1 Tax=Ancylobacter vacuolatus TaxID=223389 RepID=UPI0036290349